MAFTKNLPPGEISEDTPLTDRQEAFCRAYPYDWNGTRAAIKAGYKEKHVAVIAAKLLTLAKVRKRIEYWRAHSDESLGISKEWIANKFREIASSSIANIHNSWITRVEFEQLDAATKASIQEIDTKVIRRNLNTPEHPDLVDIEYVNIKLYDKQRALENLNKMYGHNAPEKFAGPNDEPLFPTKVTHEYIAINRTPASSEEEVKTNEGIEDEHKG